MSFVIQTGWPIEANWASVTVVASQSVIAGSAASIAMLLSKSTQSWLDELSLPYLLINQQGEVVSNNVQ